MKYDDCNKEKNNTNLTIFKRVFSCFIHFTFNFKILITIILFLFLEIIHIECS